MLVQSLLERNEVLLCCAAGLVESLLDNVLATPMSIIKMRNIREHFNVAASLILFTIRSRWTFEVEVNKESKSLRSPSQSLKDAWRTDKIADLGSSYAFAIQKTFVSQVKISISSSHH